MKSLFAFRKTYSMAPLFGAGEPREHVEMGMVEAATLADARAQLISRSSVLSLEEGVTLQILLVDLAAAESFHAQYDAPPMNDNHTPTRAKLRVREIHPVLEPGGL